MIFNNFSRNLGWFSSILQHFLMIFFSIFCFFLLLFLIFFSDLYWIFGTFYPFISKFLRNFHWFPKTYCIIQVNFGLFLILFVIFDEFVVLFTQLYQIFTLIFLLFRVNFYLSLLNFCQLSQTFNFYTHGRWGRNMIKIRFGAPDDRKDNS